MRTTFAVRRVLVEVPPDPDGQRYGLEILSAHRLRLESNGLVSGEWERIDVSTESWRHRGTRDRRP